MAKKKNEKLETEQINEIVKDNKLGKTEVTKALNAIRKQFGDESIFLLGEKSSLNVVFNSTGIPSLDRALGGGFPEGRIVEIYGGESCGKTLVALTFAAEIQRKGGLVAYIDAEHAFDPAWAAKNGVDVDNLLFTQPDSGEQALQIAESLIKSGYLDLVIIDSVAALVPEKELEGEIGDSNVGLQARLMGQALRKLTGIISKTKCTAIFINQTRAKIGGMSYGPQDTTAGGKALPFYASVRLNLARIETKKDQSGVVIKAKVIKNKVSPPFKIAQYDINFNMGIDKLADYVSLAQELNIMPKTGGWFSFKDLKAQGFNKFREAIEAVPGYIEELKELVNAKLFDAPVAELDKDEIIGEDDY